jgi:uncharacterized membrane protein
MSKNLKGKKKPTVQHPQKVQNQSRPQQAMQVHSELHQGPIPAPHTLQQYNDIVPGAAERIIAM